MEDLCQVTYKAPVNIAVIKYWGKRDETLNLPLNSSLSATLGLKELCAKTTIASSKEFKKDRFWLNGREEDIDKNSRIQRCLKEVRNLCKARHSNNGEQELKIHICSENNFPTAAGLASSAAGYACLASALGKLYGIKKNLSIIARLGSGSACRSMYGGFVKWNRGEQDDGIDSVATQVVSESYWQELRVLILVVNDQKKTTSSTDGMQRSAATSSLLQYRAKHVVSKRLNCMERAIIEKDFDNFAALTMQESNQLHAICMDTYPPISPPYLNEISHQVIQLITILNEISKKFKAAYTFDAGPNAFVFTTAEFEEEIICLLNEYLGKGIGSEAQSFIKGISPILTNIDADVNKEMKMELDRRKIFPTPGKLKYIIRTQVGSGPEELPISESLLNGYGEPKYNIT